MYSIKGFLHIMGFHPRSWPQLPACVKSAQTSWLFPKNVRPMEGERFSCPYFPQKSAMMSPWTHLEPTSVRKHYSLPPPLPLLYFLLHLSLLHAPSLPLKFFFSSSSFSSLLSIFPYSSTFPLSRPCLLSLANSHTLICWQASSN